MDNQIHGQVQRYKSKVKWVKDTYGFIVWQEKGIFFHNSQVENRIRLKEGDFVEFGISKDNIGRDIAVDIVKITPDNPRIKPAHNPINSTLLNATRQELYKDLKGICAEILNSMIEVVTEFDKLKVSSAKKSSKSSYNLELLQSLTSRAESELLTIAFFGAFSAGKSFLISGLIGRLDWFSHNHLGKTTDQYVPLIPGSPRSTSSCPLAVEPATQRDMDDQFWVVFEDTQKWERRDPVINVIIQAYVTELPNALSNRKPSDRQRNVDKAKLIVQNSQIPARLYDLPGIGAVGNKYADVVYSFVQQADCLVFVASAEKPIGEEQLELLRYVYEHHKSTQKPVFFALTQIDKHDDFDTASGKLVWQDVLAANNEFLRDYFRIDKRKADEGFIADGFIPVSAGNEAKGTKLLEANHPEGKTFLKNSNMQTFRKNLADYLISTSGPTHLTEIVLEANRALTPLIRDLTEVEEAESMPLADVHNELEAKRVYRDTLMSGQEDLRSELVKLGDTAIDRAFSKSDPDDLWSALRNQLGDKIKNEDVLKEKVIHELEMERANIIRQWISRSDGPATMWDEAWKSLEAKAKTRVGYLITKAKSAETQTKIGRDDVAERISVIPREVEMPQTLKDTIEVATKAWPAVAGLGISGVVASLLGGLSVLGPIGWTAIVTAGITGLFVNWRNSQVREKRRQDMLLDLDKLAHQAISAYKAQAHQVISSYIGILMGVVDDEIKSTNQAIDTLETRLRLPENIDRNNQLATLRGLLRETEKIQKYVENFETAFSKNKVANDSILKNHKTA